jgi:CRISPR system Cascade subunit CasE
LETKPYNPKVRQGERLAFSLRVNPVVTRWIGNEKMHHARHDVVMDAKWNLKANNVPKELWPTTSELAQTEGFKWLEARSERAGFSVAKELVRVDGYRQHAFRKGSSHREVRLSTMDFSGILTVIDAGVFVRSLFEGIGPAKGFGCGLLLIRRM